MSEDSDSKHYCFSVLEDQDGSPACKASTSCSTMQRGASGCSSMAHLQRMSGYSQSGPDLGLPSEGSDSSGQDPPSSPYNHCKSARSRSLPEEDVEMKSSGSSGSGTESHGNESHGNESHGNESNGLESVGSSNSNSKDSALLESSESNKSSNSHSPSPPSSSNAFSLLSSEQDNPSTSGCSSQESAKAKTQKEVIKTLKELKLHLPAEKRHNKCTTLNTLKHALRCVKQVQANEEYYQLLMTNDSQPSGLDVSSYTIEEIDSITSEYTLKNNDIFAVAVSLITGRIVYMSDQAASILNCKREVFKNTKFVEFLIPQDVSVFYSFTTPYRLPSWSMCTGAESSPPDCMQEKSFFCRISGGKECKGDLQYYPFRMTPYLMKVQVTVHAEDQFCCLLLAERVHSGYDAPRIPTDKRIFTTTHSPSCVFQDVDERAVPLLGYLPQDLIGTPVLLHLHPNDRPIMLAIHRKILQYAGQPFDHSSIRFRARNGEYVILDTSWSSFVNPWSRKVSFVIGRHKVRTGPVNEDVFMAPVSDGAQKKTMDSDIQEITEQIHRLLLQPVHNSGSSSYRSLNSTDHLLGMTSSGESLNNGNGSKFHLEEEEVSSKARPRTFQEICKGIHLQKSQEQSKKVNIDSVQKSSAVVRPKDSAAFLNWKENGTLIEEIRPSFHEEMSLNDHTVYSYQQISCLDSVIRYLENCNVPIALKRKCQSSCNTTSSNSDEDKHKGCTAMQVSEEPALLKDQSGLSTLEDKKPSDTATAVVGTSLPLPLPNKPESVVSITSQCSYSSTIVHVGDKKPQQESEIIEDVSGAGETGESAHNSAAPPCTVGPPSQERESYKKLGLTKQILAAHTQKEEQAFLYRFRELRKLTNLKANCSQYLERQREKVTCNVPAAQLSKQSGPVGGPNMARRSVRNKKTKSKRAKQTESSDSTASHPRYHQQQHPRAPPLNHGLNPTSWSPSDTSQATFPVAYPAVMPGYPLQVYPRATSTSPCTDATLQGFADNQGVPAPTCPPGIHHAPYTAPMVAPIVALVLPNFMYPPMAAGPPPPQPVYHPGTVGFSSQAQAYSQPAFPAQGTFMAPPPFNAQTQFNTQNPFAPQMGYMTPSFYFPPSSETQKALVEGQSRSSTPQSGGGRGGRASPPLFQSRCSSPLNLLELELSVDRQDSTVLPPGGQCSNAAEREKGTGGGGQAKERDLKQPSVSLLGPPGPLYYEGTSCVCESLSWGEVFSRLLACSFEVSGRDGNNSDANSSSSDMFDIILHEDSCSGTGSATSGSMGSRSNGCGTSASGTSNSGTSKSRTSASGTSDSGTGSNSSKYFGSVDSSQNSQKVKGHSISSEMEQSDHFMKYILQDPIWLLMANTDDKVMMTYQLPCRDIQKVLREDSEKLRLMQKNQPRFTEEQKKELIEVHHWMKKGGLPKVLDVKVCSCCNGDIEAALADVLPDLDLVDHEPVELSCQRTAREEPSSTDITSSPGSCFQQSRL
ncbi:period circadian protein homolog 2 isoform X2 [Dunckerocampus dactyliophorus]|uniref:period circadian protein homolog 2 isoform X2 n=1 Tax=Dunckerocampus dactyliophorus TaxID=161453 RepID=UPI002404912A|nr:period circadian protein homolog 2 isoform X2 [Dunckerocampus dactyliophorus]